MNVITHQAIKRLSDNVVKVYSRWSNGKTTYNLQETDKKGNISEILGREIKYPPNDVEWIATRKSDTSTMKNPNDMTIEEREKAGFNWLITRSAESSCYTYVYSPGRGMLFYRCKEEIERINNAIEIYLESLRNNE